jgi:hypothetical protein
VNVDFRMHANSYKLLKKWSGGRGSNPRRPAWEAGILPLNYPRDRVRLAYKQSLNESFSKLRPLATSRKLMLQGNHCENNSLTREQYTTKQHAFDADYPG